MSAENTAEQLVNNYNNSGRNSGMVESFGIVSRHVWGGRRIGISGNPYHVPTDEISRICSELSEQIDRRELKDGERIGTAYWDGERLTYESYYDSI